MSEQEQGIWLLLDEIYKQAYRVQHETGHEAGSRIHKLIDDVRDKFPDGFGISFSKDVAVKYSSWKVRECYQTEGKLYLNSEIKVYNDCGDIYRSVIPGFIGRTEEEMFDYFATSVYHELY